MVKLDGRANFRILKRIHNPMKKEGCFYGA